MKPVLLLQSRPEDDVCQNEFEAICAMGEISPSQVVRLQMDRDELTELNLNDYSAIIMGGGPANFADETELRYEIWLINLMRQVMAVDKPFLGMCLGIGTMAMALGVRPSFDFAEPVEPIKVIVNAEGQSDRLLEGAPPEFHALVGHKEGVGQAPEGAVELARSETCVQMLRHGQNVYATQFHPELDVPGLAIRVEAYKNHGYFEPEEAEALVENAKHANISHAATVLKNFVKHHIR